MTAKYRLRMTYDEKAVIRQEVSRCKERRRMRARGIPLPQGEPQLPEESSHPSDSLQSLSESELWERAGQEERTSLLALQATQTQPGGGVSSSSGSTQDPPREVIGVSHISATSQYIVTTRRWRNQTLPRGQAFQVDRRTGRTQIIRTGEFIPEATESSGNADPEENPRVFGCKCRGRKSSWVGGSLLYVGFRSQCNGYPMEGRHGR